ncbi:amidase [Halomonas cerina]|uniref:Asp-tRNA(Asn)/Glu-tRNA(Gln) amidotransferase A subunit family amidase n=1 Tax=Halomonas cerina TaxID=447424 RepID=A0A839VAB8_9GAMM|nr:amidase [Halomonas cerina]MBB3189657.1 Asp-tRNA(Asn)/Glu-tRNA(Gln) amidotransferase A subunit family amidase [Halomonas cerina]
MEHYITELSVLELGTLIKNRSVSCTEVTTSFLKRIESLNPRINAFCDIFYERAMQDAKLADDAIARGHYLSPLHGIPIALKDLTPTSGSTTTFGSRLFRRHKPQHDAILVERLKNKGAILVGKTNTPEFGHKGVTDNLVFGKTRNPRDLTKVAGGSSGGSAAAVAATMVPIAEGSDGAGSLRIPAALCGVVGFKPSFGRIPDVAGPFSSTTPFFHNGPISRNVHDSHIFYRAIAGEDHRDPFSLPTEHGLVSKPLPSLSTLKIAYSRSLDYFQVSPEVEACVDTAVTRLSSLGCQVEPVDLGMNLDVEECFMTLWRFKLSSTYGNLKDNELALLEPAVRQLIGEGNKITPADYGRAIQTREKVWNTISKLFVDYDFLVCPTTSVPAFDIDASPPKEINGTSINSLIGWFLTYPFNLTGNPAISLPIGACNSGLPVGMQVVGKRLDDTRLLNFAELIESKIQ